MQLVVATGNPGKLKELRRLLAGQGVDLLGLVDFPHLPPVLEDGETFAANACKKAMAVAAATGLPTMADDSGLEVRALNGAPGVFSARYAGQGASDADNNWKLLQDLDKVPQAQRQARFVCALALALPGEECRIFSGELAGEILTAPRGSDGFGYDPLFYLPDQKRSLAEVALEEKNIFSHRGRALQQLLPVLPQLLGQFYGNLDR